MALIKCKECGAEISKSAKVCPNCGKKLKSSGLSVFLGIILVLFGLGIIVGGGDVSNTATDKSSAPKEKFTLVSSEMVSDTFSTYIEGTIQNNTDKTYSYVQVTFNIYDEEGNQLGTAVDNINNFQANGTWKYKAIGLTTEDVASYEFAEITGW